MTGKCEECDAPMGCFSGSGACHKCEKVLCSKCASSWPLIPFHRTSKDHDDDSSNNDVSKHNTVYSFCKKCFQETSVLDFTKIFDVVEPTKEVAENNNKNLVTFIFVHGGGASRALYRPYADLMATRGHRSILVDLPGHGTNVDTPLTLDSCAETIRKILDDEHDTKHNLSLTKHNTIYVGGSFGAYTGFYTLDKLKDRFAGAILIDCGQNVGPDCSYKASFGLWFLKIMANKMSNKALMDAMKGVTVKSPADWKLIESTFGAGQFFDSGKEQVECLHAVKPADHIPSLKFPILFFNGTEDHRDSEDRWLSLCSDQKRSYLHDYEGGDHFFTHDSRFVSDFTNRMDRFAIELSSTTS